MANSKKKKKGIFEEAASEESARQALDPTVKTQRPSFFDEEQNFFADSGDETGFIPRLNMNGNGKAEARPEKAKEPSGPSESAKESAKESAAGNARESVNEDAKEDASSKAAPEKNAAERPADSGKPGGAGKTPEESSEELAEEVAEIVARFESDQRGEELLKASEAAEKAEAEEDGESSELSGHDAESDRPVESETERAAGKILGWVVPVFAAIILATLIRVFIGGATTVQGNSMYPTLHNGDVLLINKLPTYSETYERAEIVIIDAPHDKGKLYVKRIVGLPGETVEIHDGNVYINGKLLREYYIGEADTTVYHQSKWVLGKDQYFVLGDNRNPGASNDGRLFGPVEGKHIKGVAVLRLWPLDRFGGLF